MAIRKLGKMVKCPKCESENVIIVEVLKFECDNIIECQDCFTKFTRKLNMDLMCKCGHNYAYHVNPETKVEDGCIFSYNCDCEKFTPKQIQ